MNPRLFIALSGLLLLAARGPFTVQAQPASSAAAQTYSMDDYGKVEKIDIHFHIRADDTRFVELAAEDRFRFLNIVVHSIDPVALAERHRTSFVQHEAHPDRVAVASAFPMAGWDEPDWVAKTIRHLDETFDKGAVAVKVWKNIGMEARDEAGELIMIDDPQLDPIFAYLERRGIRLFGHLGEPKNCWLPLDQMTVNNDRNYFRNNPHYHMFRHPEMPSYEEQIRARDHMLEKHPNLPFVAAHLASLEWSVDELAKFLDRFPHAVTETAARMGQLQYQSIRDRERVRDFFIKYQDRILYGTDGSVPAGTSAEGAMRRMRERWHSDWKYFCTDEVQKVPELEEPVRGLALPRDVVEKIYERNARAFFPDSWK